MKWLAVILVVTNLAAYLLVGDRQTPSRTVRSDAGSDVNKTGMLLLAEVDALQAAATDAGGDSQPAETETASDRDEATAGERAGRTAGLTGTSTGGDEEPLIFETCYRLGPFRQEESWQAAKTWMGESGFEFTPVTSDSRQVLAFRVYLGPFTSESSVNAMLKRLKDSEVDHFRYTADNGLSRISVGVFSQEELAEKYLDYLTSKRYEAKFQPEYRHLGALNWMEVAAADIDHTRVSGHDWNESGVTMIKVNCRV